MHKFPNNKVYIGITSKNSVKKRWLHGRGYKTQQLMWRAIQKYGWDNIEHIIVAENLTPHQACDMEIDLIAKYRANEPDFGYNVYIGGDKGRFGIPLTDDEKERLVSYNKGRPKSQEEINKIKVTLSEYWTDDVRKSFGKLHGGRGHKLDENTALNIYDRLCDGASRKDLAKEFNVSNSAIDRIANKQYWSIRDSDNVVLQRRLPIRYIAQYDLQDNFIRMWNTFEEIHRALNINTGTVCECCLHKRENTKGYKWKYILVLDTGGSVIL